MARRSSCRGRSCATCTAPQRAQSNVASTLRAFKWLLRDPHFIGLTALGAFGMAAFFIYLANSSFVLIEHYGLTPRQYSLAFAVNAASFIGVSQFAGKLAERYGLPRIVSLAVLGFLGLVVPTTSVMALDDHGEIAGAASALMGTLQLVLGAVVIAVMGLFVDGTARPMVAGIAVVAVIAWVLARWTLGGRPRETAPA